jgi:hypothetical protein
MINQTISEITPLSDFLSPDRPAEVDNLVEKELPILTTQLIALIPQINLTQQQINTAQGNANSSASIANTAVAQARNYAQEGLGYRNQSMQVRDEVQSLIDNLVIPTEVTYNKSNLDNKFDKIKIQNFLSFKI